jgi:IS5 family transposase
MLFKRPTRRDRVLVDIEATTSWGEWVAVIGRRYPKGGRDRPPIGPERMRRMDIAQNGFGLCDEGREDVVDDGRAIQGFVGIDPGHVTAPDATTRFEFRRLLEDKRLTESLFTTVNARPAAKVFPRRGTAEDCKFRRQVSTSQSRNDLPVHLCPPGRGAEGGTHRGPATGAPETSST